MTSLVDFRGSGELEVFLDEEQVASLERKMNERGYLEGSEMANTFNMLRSNDLIWSFVINNYLMGRDPFPFDLLHWNCDSTRMPAKMHSFYLRNMYLENRLKKPGGITLDGVAIDLSKITQPSYFVSAIEDHIASEATFRPAYFRREVAFRSVGSAHCRHDQSPAANKYGYWTNENCRRSPRRGSRTRASMRVVVAELLVWLKPYLGPQVAARAVGKGEGKGRLRPSSRPRQLRKTPRRRPIA
jgi:polyhydroxyalkanoate synthase